MFVCLQLLVYIIYAIGASLCRGANYFISLALPTLLRRSFFNDYWRRSLLRQTTSLSHSHVHIFVSRECRVTLYFYLSITQSKPKPS